LKRKPNPITTQQIYQAAAATDHIWLMSVSMLILFQA